MRQISSPTTKTAGLLLRILLMAILTLGGLLVVSPARAEETKDQASVGESLATDATAPISESIAESSTKTAETQASEALVSSESVAESEVFPEGFRPMANLTIDLSGGASDGAGYTWDATTKVITFTTVSNNNTYTLIRTGVQNVSGIVVASGADTAIVLKGLSLTTSLPCIILKGTAKLTLSLENANMLESSDNAGIAVAPSAALTVQGSGSLVVKGGSRGAGIGGGFSVSDEGYFGDSGSIIIKSGTIWATGGDGAAGIGGGDIGSGRTIAINDGTVWATGGSGGAGIGGGRGSEGAFTGHRDGYSGGSGGVITISGGTVVATGDGSTGIGGGRGGNGGGNGTGSLGGTGGDGGDGGTITISGGAVTTTGIGGGFGGYESSIYNGGGNGGSGGFITISGGVVTSTGNYGAGIGGGAGCDGGGYNGNGGNGGSGGFITISGGTVTTTSYRGAGIGGGRGGDGGYHGYGAGNGGNGGTISIDGGVITTTGGDYSAGIGGAGGGGGNSIGSGGSGGTITISNGTVTATGDINGGAGIGGGLYASGGIIIINSGTVTATGGGGAGIGGGGDSIGNSYTSVSIAVAATVQAFAQSKDTPAIDSFYGNTGTGHYVIGCLDARNYACILVYYADGSTERTGSLILPADYASFAYTTGTDTVRTDRIFAYQTLGNAYLGRAERVYDSSPDITSTKNAAPVELRLNSDAALVPPDYGNLKIPVTQHEGSGREDTAARASVKAYPDPTQVDNVILAYSYDFPDALAASYLAGVLGAPILLCDTSEVPATTAAELNRLNPSAIYIVGGTGVISSEVENSLRSSGSVSSVTRLGGQGREETAYLIANAAKNLGGVPTSAFVAHSGNFPDALSAGSLSAGQGVPILLTPTGTLDAWAQRFLDENGVRDIIIVGGTGSVSEAAEDQLRALPSAPAVTRWSGTGRYETAEAVLKSAITKWNITPTVIGLASGEDFPDALVGGAAVGNRGGLLAITEPDALSAAATGIISTYKGTISDVEIFGGTGTIRVKTQAQELLS